MRNRSNSVYLENILLENKSERVKYKPLLINGEALKELHQFTGWLNPNLEDNKTEMGGILVGMAKRNDAGTVIGYVVTHILRAETSCRYPGYVEWSGLEEIRLQRVFWEIQDKFEKNQPDLAKELRILGWWHTHPNSLPVFMSGTDMKTQQLKYFQPNEYSIVLNPHRGIIKAFAGKDAVEVPFIYDITECKKNVANVKDKHIYNGCHKKKRREKRLRRKNKLKYGKYQKYDSCKR